MTGYFRKYVSSGRWSSGGFEFEGPHGEPSNIFSKLVFQLAGEKKRTMSCSGEARFRVLIIQHTPNKWASFLESTVASRQSNALRLLVTHLMISRRPYGESFCHHSKSPGTKLHDLRTNSSRHEPILILNTVVIGWFELSKLRHFNIQLWTNKLVVYLKTRLFFNLIKNRKISFSLGPARGKINNEIIIRIIPPKVYLTLRGSII